MDTASTTTVVPVVGMLPVRGSAGAAAFDLSYAPENEHARAMGFILRQGERRLVPTGSRIALAPNQAGLVLPRSGLAKEHGVTVLNAPGLIDPDYRGDIGVILVNLGERPFHCKAGTRIAQLLIVELPDVSLNEVDDFDDETERGSNGFGSTGE